MPRERTPLMVVQRDGTMRPARDGSAPTLPRAPRFPIVIQFDRSKAVPTGASLQKLRRCAEWLALDRRERIVVIGHANLRSWEKSALALASERATTVRDLLFWLGAQRHQIVQASASQLHRIRSGSMRAERMQARVVEIWRKPQPARSNAKAVSPPARVPSRLRRARGAVGRLG